MEEWIMLVMTLRGFIKVKWKVMVIDLRSFFIRKNSVRLTPRCGPHQHRWPGKPFDSLIKCICLYKNSQNSCSGCPLLRCWRPKSQQPSVVIMWEKYLLVVGPCKDTIQYPLARFFYSSHSGYEVFAELMVFGPCCP